MSSEGYTYLIQVDTNGNAILPTLARNADKADVSLRRVATGSTKGMASLNANARKAGSGVGSMGKAADKTSSSIGLMGNEADKSFNKIDRGASRQGLTRVKTKAKQVTESIRQIGRASDTGLGRLERRANSSRSAMSRLRSAAAAVGLTMSVGMAAGAVVGTGAGFEKSMSTVKALSQATNTEMVSLTAAARQAGATTAFSARESADAMGYLALAGYDASQQIEALPATLNLAAAGSLDLARSADIATNILSQYRMKASQTGIVVDQLAYTQSRFNTNIEELSDAMTYWGPSAASLNIKLSESNAVIGLLANNGLKGSIATRALSTSIVRLSKPTSLMSQGIKQLGVDFFDAKGEFVGVANMVDQLNTAMQGYTAEQRVAAVSTIFGSEAIQEMSILLNEGAGKIKYWTDELDNAEGTAKRMSDIKLDNLAGDFTILKSVSQEFSLGLYDTIGPALRAITQEATLFVSKLDTREVGLMLRNTILDLRKGVVWIGKHKDLIVNLGKAMIVLKATTMAYSAGLRVVQSYTAAATLVKWGYIAATRGATVATRALNTAVMASPWGLALGAITAVVSAVALFRDTTKEASNAQGDLNQELLENQLLKQDTKDVAEQTKLDKAKLSLLGKKDTRQLKQVKEASLQRAMTIEDSIVTLKAKAKTSPEYAEYKALRNKDKESTKLTASGVPVSTLSVNDKQRMIELERKINAMPESQTGLTLNALTKLASENKAIAAKAATLLPKEEDTVPPLGGTLPTGTGVVDEGGGQMTENVISGGQRQTTINITVEKFQDNVNFNIQGQVNELKDSVEDMRAMINEQFLRILNSANQLAHV